MKQIVWLLFIVFSNYCYSQKKLPVIKATSVKASIYEGINTVSGWNLSPETKPDIFVTGKLTGATVVKFKTDCDSLSLLLNPGEKKDFIVLLNGKDSCYTRIQAPEIKKFSNLKPEVHDTIPFIINSQNTIYVQGVLNKTDTLNLNFDSGTTQLVLTEGVLKTRIKSTLKLYNTPYELQIGKRNYQANVYDAELTGHDTDGRFGWDLFDGMLLELNYDMGVMVVHSKMPKNVKKDKSFTKLNIKYVSQLFFVESTITQNGVENKDSFLFDTGYQRTVMLDNDLLKQNNFPTEKMNVIKKVLMHGATGNEIPVITSNLENLKIGNYDLKNVPAQILTANKPVRNANIHILGNEVLKRFNIILDFQDNVVYMKPNKMYNNSYIEEGIEIKKH